MKPNLTVYKSSAGSGKTFTLSVNYIAICLSNKSNDYFKKIKYKIFIITEFKKFALLFPYLEAIKA